MADAGVYHLFGDLRRVFELAQLSQLGKQGRCALVFQQQSSRNPTSASPPGDDQRAVTLEASSKCMDEASFMLIGTLERCQIAIIQPLA
jgi:hypothetical protein